MIRENWGKNWWKHHKAVMPHLTAKPVSTFADCLTRLIKLDSSLRWNDKLS
jgi:hypothetical protein